jgi:2-phosphosulfolactate phosphatase
MAVRSTASLALDAALTPHFVPSDPSARARTVYIVVDVIRATTTLAVMVERGCRRVLVAPGIAEARAVAQSAPGTYLLGGESGGVAPAGFDFGNSPREYAAAELAGRELVFATSNGTRALRACAGAFAIYAGSLRNAGAVARTAVESALAARRLGSAPGQVVPAATDGEPGASEAATDDDEPADIVVVCAGREGRPAYDDTLCAGYLLDRIAAEASERGLGTTLESEAKIAVATCRYVMRRPEGLRTALAESGAGQSIRAVGLAGDLDWCAAIDASPVVPYVAAVDAERDLLELRDAMHQER